MSAAHEQATVQTTRRTYTLLKPQMKHAIWAETGRLNSAALKELLVEALTARGWTEDRIESEYIEYVRKCRRKGLENMFPGGRIA